MTDKRRVRCTAERIIRKLRDADAMLNVGRACLFLVFFSLGIDPLPNSVTAADDVKFSAEYITVFDFPNLKESQLAPGAFVFERTEFHQGVNLYIVKDNAGHARTVLVHGTIPTVTTTIDLPHVLASGWKSEIDQQVFTIRILTAHARSSTQYAAGISLLRDLFKTNADDRRVADLLVSVAWDDDSFSQIVESWLAHSDGKLHSAISTRIAVVLAIKREWKLVNSVLARTRGDVAGTGLLLRAISIFEQREFTKASDLFGQALIQLRTESRDSPARTNGQTPTPATAVLDAQIGRARSAFLGGRNPSEVRTLYHDALSAAHAMQADIFSDLFLELAWIEVAQGIGLDDPFLSLKLPSVVLRTPLAEFRDTVFHLPFAKHRLTDREIKFKMAASLFEAANGRTAAAITIVQRMLPEIPDELLESGLANRPEGYWAYHARRELLERYSEPIDAVTFRYFPWHVKSNPLDWPVASYSLVFSHQIYAEQLFSNQPAR
ncbi:MAG: hypothetical protein Fues2KO_53260 [Fuerstiella sp.]